LGDRRNSGNSNRCWPVGGGSRKKGNKEVRKPNKHKNRSGPKDLLCVKTSKVSRKRGKLEKSLHMKERGAPS